MAQLNIKIDDAEIKALRAYAAGRRTPVSWLIKDYIHHLVRGGQPIDPQAQGAFDATVLTDPKQWGGTLDWLADERDLYGPKDGQPV